MNLIVRDTEWNERLQSLLTMLDPEIGVENLKRFIQEGKFFAHEVIYNGVSIGFYIFRIDTMSNGKRELVILHAISEIKGPKPLVHILNQIFPGVGMQYNCRRIRIHSESRKMDDLLEAGGFRFMESVFIKEI